MIMGQQTYITTKVTDQIREQGYITTQEFNKFIHTAIQEKLERERTQYDNI